MLGHYLAPHLRSLPEFSATSVEDRITYARAKVTDAKDYLIVYPNHEYDTGNYSVGQSGCKTSLFRIGIFGRKQQTDLDIVADLLDLTILPGIRNVWLNRVDLDKRIWVQCLLLQDMYLVDDKGPAIDGTEYGCPGNILLVKGSYSVPQPIP